MELAAVQPKCKLTQKNNLKFFTKILENSYFYNV